VVGVVRCWARERGATLGRGRVGRVQATWVRDDKAVENDRVRCDHHTLAPWLRNSDGGRGGAIDGLQAGDQRAQDFGGAGAEGVQGGDVFDRALPPEEADVVGKEQAAVVSTQRVAGCDSTLVSAEGCGTRTGDSIGGCGVLDGEQFEVEEAAGSVSPQVGLPVLAAERLPVTAVGDVDPDHSRRVRDAHHPDAPVDVPPGDPREDRARQEGRAQLGLGRQSLDLLTRFPNRPGGAIERKSSGRSRRGRILPRWRCDRR
jgi:hypothetical protein